MKIYAELYGDIQMYRIKSRYGNNLETYRNMAKSLSNAMKVVAMPSINIDTEAISGISSVVGSTALELGKAGDVFAPTG